MTPRGMAWWRAFARGLLATLVFLTARLPAQDVGAQRLDGGRFSVFAYPADQPMARALLASALATDTFPGLPRPVRRVTVAIAPDRQRFREWGGPAAPEWGAALALLDEHRVVMQGSRAGSGAGDPMLVLRHELAHLALHEGVPRAIPRWFDEGYASLAAGEWGRDQLISMNVALALRRGRSFASLDSAFAGGSGQAQGAYALSHRAVAEMAALDPARGLALLFGYWREEGALDPAMRRAFGITLQGFEVLWQERTRHRYGALALATDLGIAGVAMLALAGPLWWARHRRNRRRMRALMAADEAADRRARDTALAALLGPAGNGGIGLDDPHPPGPGFPPDRESPPSH